MEKNKKPTSSCETLAKKESQSEILKKKKAKAETSKFKSKYFDYYDDIKISDRQDW